MKKNTKLVILKQKGTRMAEDGEDWNGLKMMILKSLANFFKIHKRWHSSWDANSQTDIFKKIIPVLVRFGLSNQSVYNNYCIS